MKGLITIRRRAVGTDSFLGEFGMNLSSDPRRSPSPRSRSTSPTAGGRPLSSVGPIDESQLFYLESRGIPPDEARKFIVLGFLEPVVARVPLVVAQDHLATSSRRSGRPAPRRRERPQPDATTTSPATAPARRAGVRRSIFSTPRGDRSVSSLLPRRAGAVAREVVEASGSGARDAVGAGGPAGLEELAKAVLRRRQRDARDDRLEEPEDDELAGLVGRDAAALEVEQLRLVDRADGARVGRARQSGWSISSDGIATDRAAFDRFIPNSPRKLSVPWADFSIVMRPFM